MAMQRVDLGEVPYREAVDAMAGWVEQRRAGLARFTACRLGGVEMTSLRRLADRAGRPRPPEPAVRDALAAALGAAALPTPTPMEAPR